MQNSQAFSDSLPKHIAIIMDGNGRWAKSKGKPRVFGHKKGVNAVRKTVAAASKLGIKAMTLFTSLVLCLWKELKRVGHTQATP